MADVASALRSWSATPGSNLPAGTTSIGTGLDDNLREIQAVVRKYMASAGSNMASGATVDLSTADGFYINITGTTTITSLGTESAGIQYLLKFANILTLTHNATSLILPAGTSITTTAGDLALMISEGSGNWRCVHYSNVNNLSFIQSGTGAVARTAQAKMRESVSVKDFGAVGDGFTDDTVAIQAAIAAADNLYWPEGTYLVNTASNAMVPTSKTGMWWSGYGATIKAKDGATAAGNALMLRLFNCTDVVIEGLTLDGNRDNRSAFASSSHCIQINDGDNITLRDVVVKNSTYDGIYVRGTTPGTESTYPTKILLDNVVVDNAYRNGLSLIGANGVTIRGGRFTNTNGTAPQAGIDIEPNPSDTYSVKNVLIDGAHFENNTGTGITITGNSGLLSENIRIVNCSGALNEECLLLAAYTSNLIVDGLSIANDDTIPTRTGIVSILAYAGHVVLNGLQFRDLDGISATKACIWIEVGATSPRYVNDLRSSDINCQTLLAQSQTHTNGVHVDNDDSTEPAIYFSSHSYSTLRNAVVTNKTGASSVAVRIASTFTTVENITMLDVQAGLRMEGENNKYRNITLLKNGTATLYGAYMDTATGVVIENVNISDSGGYYTSATAFNVSAVASLAGARFRNVYPSPLEGSATWNPADIATGAQATTTVSVTRADVGDFVMARHSVTLGGLQSFAYVSSANTVTVGLSNTSGGNINLDSHTVTVEVIK